MVKPLNRTVKNEICFVYKNAASDKEGLTPNTEVTVVNIDKNGNYIIRSDGKERNISRVSAKLVMVYE